MKQFLRIIILVLVVSISYVALYLLFGSNYDWMHEMRAKSVMKNAYQIHQACMAYAQSHEGAFPDGKSSNEAFRKLFEQDLIDDEKLFYIKPRGDGWPRSPDGNIGTKEDGYSKALEAGECCFYYVRGANKDKSNGEMPLIFTKFGASGGKIYWLCARVGGNARVQSEDSPDMPLDAAGNAVDIFSKEYLKEKYGIEPQDILAPEGSIPGPWELPGPKGAKSYRVALIVSGSGATVLILLVIFRKLGSRSGGLAAGVPP